MTDPTAHTDTLAPADEQACLRLCAAFVQHLDARRYAQVLDLFTEDGVLDRLGTVYAGRTALAEFLVARPASLRTRHLSTSIVIDQLAADEARGCSYVLFFQGTEEAADGDAPPRLAGPPTVVEYHDRFVRTPQGWRIRERRIRLSFRPAA